MAVRKGMSHKVRSFYREEGKFDEEDLVFNKKTGKYECMKLSQINRLLRDPDTHIVLVRRAA